VRRRIYPRWIGKIANERAGRELAMMEAIAAD
jgi:hypothetical protein